jgi:uncharacterized protein YprB with RNaseH-like and TPR domain
MYQYLDFDVESFEDNVESFMDECDVKPSRNLKDPDKIKKNIGEKLAKIRSQAALSWYTSRPVTICIYDSVNDLKFSFSNRNPKELLTEFCTKLALDYPDHVLIGKNSSKFDIPIIIGWLIKYDLGVPIHFKRDIREPITDIDHIFGRSTTMNSQLSTLDNYAFGMGIKGKTMAGNMVADLYMKHQMTNDPKPMNEIVEYCHNDVAIVSEMRRRFLKSFVPSLKPMDMEGVF